MCRILRNSNTSSIAFNEPRVPLSNPNSTPPLTLDSTTPYTNDTNIMMEEQAQYATYLPSGSNHPQLVSSPPPLLTPPPAPFPPLPTPSSSASHNPTHLHHVTSTRTNASRRHSSRRSSHTPSHRSSSPPPGGHQASHSISGMGSILPEHIPTVGLLNSLPGAAHYSGQAASVCHCSFT